MIVGSYGVELPFMGCVEHMCCLLVMVHVHVYASWYGMSAVPGGLWCMSLLSVLQSMVICARCHLCSLIWWAYICMVHIFFNWGILVCIAARELPCSLWPYMWGQSIINCHLYSTRLWCLNMARMCELIQSLTKITFMCPLLMPMMSGSLLMAYNHNIYWGRVGGGVFLIAIFPAK